MYIYAVIYLFIISLTWGDMLKRNQRWIPIIVAFLTLILFVGFKGTVGGDTPGYLDSWAMTKTLWEGDFKLPQLMVYSDYGFYWLSMLLKTIWDNPAFYFFSIALLTFCFLFKSLRQYALYPLLGLTAYLARFYLLRDFNQIRASLAIAIIMYTTKYIAQRQFRKLFPWLIIACMLHISMLTVLPFYFLNRIRLTRKQIYILTGTVFCLSFVLNSVFKNLFAYITAVTGTLSAYTSGEYAEGLGMLNPMIYFQLLLLLGFTALEPQLKDVQPYYYTIRNGYLFSTLILMLFSSLLVIGARVSTIFATYEMFIIPAFVAVLNRRSRMVTLPLLFGMLLLLYVFNITRMGGNLVYGT